MKMLSIPAVVFLFGYVYVVNFTTGFFVCGAFSFSIVILGNSSFTMGQSSLVNH